MARKKTDSAGFRKARARAGGLAGGPARAAKLGPRKRRAIARAGAAAANAALDARRKAGFPERRGRPRKAAAGEGPEREPIGPARSPVAESAARRAVRGVKAPL